MRRAYQTDLSDAEWSYIEPYLPTPQAPGRPRVHTLREIIDAMFYIVRSGCAWRLLPHDFPPWKTIHHYFRSWRLETALGKEDCTPLCASGYGSVWDEILSPALGSSIASQSRVPV